MQIYKADYPMYSVIPYFDNAGMHMKKEVLLSTLFIWKKKININ